MKEEQIKSKVDRRKEIVNISTEMGGIKTRKPMKIDETKNWENKILNVTWIFLNLLNIIESPEMIHIYMVNLFETNVSK